MKKRVGAQLVALLVPLALLSMGTSKPKSDAEGGAAAGDPLAGDNAKLVGDWSGAGAIMHIGADKTIHYESTKSGVTKKYDGSLASAGGGKIVIDALIDVTLNVQRMPTDVDGSTVMTVEGIDMYKGGLVGNLDAIITQQYKSDGITKTECPATVTADSKTFECVATTTYVDPLSDAGIEKKIKVQVTEKDTKGDYDFHLESQGFVLPKVAGLIPKTLGPFALANVDCGPGTVFVDVGSSFECGAVDSKTHKNLKIIVTRQQGDTLHFQALPR